MRNIRCFLLPFLLLGFGIWGCSEGTDTGNSEKEVEISDSSEQSQQAYADDETSGGFSFTAKSSWTATVTETPASRSSSVPWLRLIHEGKETYSGGPGKFTMTIELDPNHSGKTRSATITILGGNDRITVTVTQEGERRDGEVPEKRRMVVDITETASLNSDYYDSENGRTYNPYRYEFKYDEKDRLKEYYIRDKNSGSLNAMITLSYEVQGEIRITKSYGEDEEYEDTYVAELNASGYVTRLTDKQHYDEENNHVDFLYNGENYLSEATTYMDMRSEGPHKILFRWSEGNLASFDYEGERNGVASFIPETNDKANIDLNAFFFGLLANDPLFDYPNDMEENILAMADRFGKRSRNYMAERNYESGAEPDYALEIYTARNEPQVGATVRAHYDRNFHGEGSYSFDGKGYPTEFTHQVKVDKDLYTYTGEKFYIEPADEREAESWLHMYGEGPYFTIGLNHEETTVYDTYTYRITYKE